MKMNCPHCGTVNWADAPVCVRCKLSPADPVVREPEEEILGVERLRRDMGEVKMPTSRKILLTVLAAVSIFCLYNYFRSTPADPAPAAVAANAPAANAANSANAQPVAQNANAPASGPQGKFFTDIKKQVEPKNTPDLEKVTAESPNR